MYTRNYQIRTEERRQSPVIQVQSMGASPSAPRGLPAAEAVKGDARAVNSVPQSEQTPSFPSEPPIKEDAEGSEVSHLLENEREAAERRRFRVRRMPKLNMDAECETPCVKITNPDSGCDDKCNICETPCVEEPRDCERIPPRAEKEGGLLSGLFSRLGSSRFSTDEMLVLALAVLLLCQGADDILVLALCFIIL